jgi:two-component system, NtrC family, sensor kinase
MGRSPSKMRRAGKPSGRRSTPKRTKKVAAKGRTATKPPARRRGAEAEIASLSRELSEARARQAAASEVLQVISSSPGDLKPVFEAMLAKAMRLCEAQCGFIYQIERGAMRAVAEIGVPPAFAEYRRHHLHTGGATTPADVVRATRRPAHVHDARDSDAYRQGNPNAVAGVELGGARTVLYVPMIRNDEVVGVVNLFRQEVRPFADEQIALLENFAGQAVIAIENARLFNETREALAQQTATSEVLRVISSSVADTAPVFEKILDSCENLFATEQLGIFLTRQDGQTHVGAWRGAAFEAVTHTLPRPVEQTATGLVIRSRSTLHIPNTATAREMPASVWDLKDRAGDVSMAWAPMLAEQGGIGSIAVMRQPPSPFSNKELALLKTFADQAVIAIQNTRLFNETREALERQTATADILKVIASSPDDVQPVFEAIAERSTRLVNGLSTAVYSLIGDMVHLMAFTPISPDADAMLRAAFPTPLANMGWGEAIGKGKLAFVADAEIDLVTRPYQRQLARLRGWRSWMGVPLLRDRNPIGVITVTRIEPGRFDDRHVQILKTFADQAVIAISNVELFQEVQERTRELSKSLDDLRAAQDRLVQTEKLASLGQLTAGIAHEIKNPLNFINNFSALSAELIDELGAALAPVTLDEKTRGDVGELTQMLKSNLEKVVQHGKRADSIVKNMLLHSREGSGERRSADINALVEESLHLAYHGARAESSDFQITLQRDLDPEAGEIDLYPQEITRALLNMISNGFYAATRRASAAGNGFEPTLQAATRSLSDRVEIRIRDNGTGIPREVKDKMFNPFFTTKPAGEGTGLGLSMSHDIIVKQHGGTIDVETESGHFTEFVISLPRANNSRNRG